MTDILPALDATPDGDVATVIADPTKATVAELTHAYVALGALKDTVEKVRKKVHNEVDRRAKAHREKEGVSYGSKAPGIGWVTEQNHAAQTVVDGPEACAAWIAEQHHDLYDEAVEIRRTWEVDGGKVEAIVHDLRGLADGLADGFDMVLNGHQARRIADQIAAAVSSIDETVVHVDVLDREFRHVGTKMVDADEQIVPGVSVVPSRPKGVSIGGDRKYVPKLKRAFERRMAAAATPAEAAAQAVDG